MKKENKNTKLKRLLIEKRNNEKLIAKIRRENYNISKQINELID